MKFKINQKVKVLNLDIYSNVPKMTPTIGKIGIVKPNSSNQRTELIRVVFPDMPKHNRGGEGWVYAPTSLRPVKLKIG